MPVAIPDNPTTIPNSFTIPTVNLDRNWNVILHNDDNVYAGIVLDALSEVMGYSETKCKEIMLEAHQNGRASVVITTELAAKHYKEQLEGYGLTISIEKLN